MIAVYGPRTLTLVSNSSVLVCFTEMHTHALVGFRQPDGQSQDGVAGALVTLPVLASDRSRCCTCCCQEVSVTSLAPPCARPGNH